ncbi:MAG: V-type ATP synthase subunit E family protein [Candidatus Omnitrophica bacterium]|jgi:vacuolar-type H+-ATPase subunit E/Vma4|nr:V-type ATP synthase subunit E family protein [Candidatus Omnitrophota bacterium]
MNKQPVPNVNKDNADAICAKIILDAEGESRQLFKRAEFEARQILDAAKKDAQARKDILLRDVEKEIEKAKEKVLSTLNLEKKRLILEGKQRFVDNVLAEVKKKAAGLRNDPQYPEFLADAVIEGMRVLDVSEVIVYHAACDEHIFNEGFIKKVTQSCGKALNRQCAISFNKSDFNDIGVIINSQDGRIMYDNRFEARLERSYEDIYMELLKGAA